MIEDTLSVDPDIVQAVDRFLRRLGDNPTWCDHCNHGDHHVCKRWGWDAGVCKCRHGEETT